jgi:co-chaperonin GroES (HSP10)
MKLGAVKGKVRPIRDHVLVSEMEFDAITTQSGIYIPSQNGKVEGIKPRWGKVYAVGPEQQDVKVGEWIYVEHGRWTRGVTLQDDEGNEVVIRRVDNDAILLQAEEPPKDVYIPK